MWDDTILKATSVRALLPDPPTTTHQRQLFESVFQQAPNAMLILDPSGRVLRINARAERLFKLDEAEILAMPLSYLLAARPQAIDVTTSFDDGVDEVGAVRSGSWTASVRHPNGGNVPVVVTTSAIATDHNTLWMAVIHDISLTPSASDTSGRQVLHDPLTGLPNRDLFLDRLGRAVGRARRRSDYAFAVLILDLDRFQVINGSLGHAIGDDLLRAVARRIEDCGRAVDTIARLGGDEFAMLMDDIRDPSEVVRVADRLLAEISKPFDVQGQQVYTSVSIGIALSATGYDNESDMLRDADTAMYRAKAMGKARHEMFDSAMHTRALNLLRMEAELRQALERQQFRVFFQPIVDAVNDQFVGFEALVRWEHPERGLVPPGDFIPVAEDTGLIVPIGNWILREACARVRTWQVEGYGPLRIAVNCSARQFEQPGFDEVVAAILRETGLPPDQLELEITEGVIVRNVSASATLERLRARGIRIAVDDFGTGYSALGYLKNLPITSLKVDQSFVRDVIDDPRSAAIVRVIVELAHGLGINVIAEGVETEAQLAFLRELACDEFQGFLVSRPVPSDQAVALLSGRHALAANAL